MSLKKLTPDSYRVGWICPLEVEQIAAMQMLDEVHSVLEQSFTDHNVYTLGSINGHNVVIAGLPQTGNCSAATVVTQMRMTFRNLRYGLLVGIGGGVPTETDDGVIRLGHVVVSKPIDEHSGAVQYDRGKAEVGHLERTGSLMPPPAVLLNAAQSLAVQRARIDYDPIWRDTLRFNTKIRGQRQFNFPGIANDHLYQPDYYHQKQGMSCEKAGCKPEQRIKRPVDEDDEEFVVVHRGTIASGELVIKSASRRDRLAQRHRVLCFETEAAGALADFPCMVIRGISDYCDSHKNNSWKGFAAAAAAAYARQLFFHMPIELVQDSPCKPTPFKLPFYLPEISRISKFIAREEELTRMHEALQSAAQRRRVAVLHGLGGIGKTQLAIEYSDRYRKDYSTSVWLDARDETTINQSLLRLATRIDSHGASVNYISAAVQGKDQTQIVAAVKRWFEEPENNYWLIIYDNYDHPNLEIAGTKNKDCSPLPKEKTPRADSVGLEGEATSEPYDIRKYLPEADHGAIIVTSRVSLRKLGSCIQIEKFQHLEEGLEILALTSCRENIRQGRVALANYETTRLRQFETDSAAIELAQRLDGLPLALASAGAYLEQVPITCTEYLQEYQKSWVQLHEGTSELPSYDKALCTTWNISYTHIEKQNSNAALLLRQWAYFDNNDIWYELLQGGEYKPDWLRDLTKDRLTFHGVMKLLCNHGLVQASLLDTPNAAQRAGSAGYSVHACVHSWMIHVLNQHLCEEMTRAALHCVASYVLEPEQPESLSKQRRLLRHADRCYDMINTIEVRNEELELTYNLGSQYFFQGRFGGAEAMYERALQGLQRRFKKAGALLSWALEGRRKVWGPEHSSTLETVVNLGLLYYEQDRFREAEAMYERALQGQEKVLGPEHPATLITVGNLRHVYASQARYEEAEAMYERALQGFEKVLGPENPATLNTVGHLGSLYTSQARFEEAEAMYKRTLKGFEKAWGPEHLLTLGTMTNLGILYSEQCRFNEAKAQFEQTLTGYEKTLGLKSMKTNLNALSCLQSFGNLYYKQGELQNAREYYIRAQEGCLVVYGADTPIHRYVTYNSRVRSA
ncbi:hypothetical protein TRIATDRAFT_280830 [Trichoderma atroviride IMI 206040]|uniref:Nucleoside phosphorylase domain-containing protein n=1 Tax=Hypocrea atroviridis (strain ATCC 20476 / IMI 206040) TaxID=452589 RepID=G9NIQ6_HYPAI|nr:uncharacterized protein TRIATDRAFT_280830 [Trichoderma atroviride IMI 206040]EHK49666.1 hypothetical protein TRIATDRAFT_280830 [Trichoderma atroviride IMI 206040]